MLHAYQVDGIKNPDIEKAFVDQTNWNPNKATPVVIKNSQTLEKQLESPKTFKGMTATAGGFYGPQGRVLRLPVQDPDLNHNMDNFNFNGLRVTNLEMETSAIYGLAKLLGHQAVSLNAIIANRATGNFSENPAKTVEELITYTLNKIVE